MTSDLLLLSAGDEFSRSPRYELFVRDIVNDKFPGKSPIEAQLPKRCFSYILLYLLREQSV
jgi:hypothetical protein